MDTNSQQPPITVHIAEPNENISEEMVGAANELGDEICDVSDPVLMTEPKGPESTVKVADGPELLNPHSTGARSLCQESVTKQMGTTIKGRNENQSLDNAYPREGSAKSRNLHIPIVLVLPDPVQLGLLPKSLGGILKKIPDVRLSIPSPTEDDSRINLQEKTDHNPDSGKGYVDKDEDSTIHHPCDPVTHSLHVPGAQRRLQRSNSDVPLLSNLNRFSDSLLIPTSSGDSPHYSEPLVQCLSGKTDAGVLDMSSQKPTPASIDSMSKSGATESTEIKAESDENGRPGPNTSSKFTLPVIKVSCQEDEPGAGCRRRVLLADGSSSIKAKIFRSHSARGVKDLPLAVFFKGKVILIIVSN